MSVSTPRTTPHNASASSSGDGGIMTSLYRLKVGSVNAAYYQGVFERFETLGKVAPMWNHGAGFCTLAWLLLRQLWRPAAIYAALLAVCGLLWWGLHGNVPTAVEAAAVAAMALVLTVIPGFMGNALYYESVRTQTMKTLGEARNLSQAQLKLQENAVSKDRLHVIAGVQALVSAALLGLAAHHIDWQTLRQPAPAAAVSGPPTLNIPSVAQVQAANDLQPFTPDTPLPAPLVSADAPSNVPPVSDAAAPAASAANDPNALSIVQLAQSIPASPETVAAAASAAAATAAATTAAVATTTRQRAVPPAPSTREKAATPSTATKTAVAAKAASPTKTPAASANAATHKNTPPTAGQRNALQPGKFYLNAGVYAQASNVNSAVRKLKSAKLNVSQQTVSSNKGELTRLRIGPFDTRAQAEAAAAKAKRLQFDVSVYQQPRR